MAKQTTRRTKGNAEAVRRWRWRPGQSGNPGGRPKGFAARIQALTGGEHYPKLVEAFAVIALGSAAERRAFFGEAVRVTARDRLIALQELRDSGPGKPTQRVRDETPLVPLFNLPDGIEPDVGAVPRTSTNGHDNRP